MNTTEGHPSDPDRHCIGCQFRSPVFSYLSDQELEMVEKTKISVLFSAGETIRKQGTFLSHVISVNAGLAKIFLEGPEHHNAIIRIVKPTNFIGGPGIYLDQRHHFTVTALVETTVCFIEVGVFKELMDNNKTFAHEVMKDFSRSILSVYNRLLFLTQKQMPGRMADTLFYLADEIFCSNRFTLCLSRQELSELSGMSRESANKVLRQFSNDGIIHITNDHLEITDPERLRMISLKG